MFDVVTRKIDFIRLYFSEFSIDYGYSVSTILQDLQWHIHGIILLLTFGIGYLANAHVRVDVFREHIHPRKQAWLEFIGLLVMAVIATLFRLAAFLFGPREEHDEAKDSLTIFNYEHHRPE